MYAPWHNGIEILIRQKTEYGFAVVKELELTEVRPGEVFEPSLRIDNVVAQTLIDDLWNSGMRPTEGSGSAGSLKATEKHLEDMRKIVSHKLSINLSKTEDNIKTGD
jgi:hypothetical protein